MRGLLTIVLAAAAVGRVSAGCTDAGNGGCSPPTDKRWDTWSMRASTYTYCYDGCVMEWLINNTVSLGLNKFAGVVGVDHYYTQQGMPCINGQPQEFAMQDALTIKWKGIFPEMRFLQYRIVSAVPYDMVVQNKITSDPDSVVRWRHQPGSSAPGNGTVCYNYASACFNDPTRINNPDHHCSFEIRAAAYNWSNPTLPSWYLNNVIKPTMVHADGVWLDGIGPDNGAYMCAGVCCGYGPTNSPLLGPEIDAHCAGQMTAGTMAQKWLISNGGWEAMRCFDYKVRGLPTADDTAAQCAANLKASAAMGADHSKYNFIVAYGSRTGGRSGYNDTTVAGTVAAFLLMRGPHWLFSIAPTPGTYSGHSPLTAGSLLPATAKVLLSDYGLPKGLMSEVPGKPGVFQREFEGATVSLDCASWTPTFTEHAVAEAEAR